MRTDDADAEPVPATPALPASAAQVIAALAPLVTSTRLARLEQVVAARTYRVIPVLDAVHDPHNVSAVLRSADAFGLQEVHVVAADRGFHAARSVSKGAHKWMTIVRHADAHACLDTLHGRGYEVLVASMGGVLRPEDLASRGKVALVFGNEHAGASGPLAAGADGSFCVPMAGFVESLNVSVAAAIALRAARGGATGDLSSGERLALLARFLMASVRDADRIVLDHVAART